MGAYMLRFIVPLFITITSTAAADNLPVRFTELNQPVLQAFTVGPQEPITMGPKEPWPFTESEVVIACGRGALAVVKVGPIYAALNRYTSGYSDTMKVIEQNGSPHSIINTRDNRQYRQAGIVKQAASDYSIGTWWGVLLNKLKNTPSCHFNG